MFLVPCYLNCKHTLARLKLYWLSEKFAPVNPESRMGIGIGQWLLNCTKYRYLTVFSLVMPRDSKASIYDHLAWRLIGLYKGHQQETSST
jgi:3-mercaptopropionate dioxygenase